MAWLSVMGSFIAVLMSIMDIQITNAAIEPIQRALHAPLSAGSWLSSVYLMAESLTLPLTAWLTNRLGYPRYALTFIGLFLLSSLLCAHAWDLPSMLLFRALQGIASGALSPFAYTLIIRCLPVQDHPRAIGLFGATVALAPTAGPALGGWLVGTLGWQSLFYINLPIGVLALCMLWPGLRRLPRPQQEERPLDLRGVMLVTIGMGALQYMLGQREAGQGGATAMLWLSAALVLVSLAGFWHHQLRTRYPLIKLSLLEDRALRIACIGTLVSCGSIFAFYFLVPYFLASVHHYSPAQISEVVLVTGLTQMVVLLFSGKIMQRFPLYLVIVAGALLVAVHSLMWAWATWQFVPGWLMVAQVIRGIGHSLLLAPLCVAVTTSIQDPTDAPMAGILFNVSRSLGGAIGLALLSSWVHFRHDAHAASLQAQHLAAHALAQQSHALAFRDTFLLITGVLLLIAAVFGRLYLQQRRSEQTQWQAQPETGQVE